MLRRRRVMDLHVRAVHCNCTAVHSGDPHVSRVQEQAASLARGALVSWQIQSKMTS